MAISVEDRRRALSVLAKAEAEELERRWSVLALAPAYRHLRPPETGLVMLRGRVGGSGGPFNVGEMTVTRCSLVLEDGTVGHGYVGGCDVRHAELMALCDALLQGSTHHDAIEEGIVGPLATAHTEQRQRKAARAAATRVEFFTVAREGGE